MNYFFIIFVFLLSNAESQMIQRTKVLMGTFVSISLLDANKSLFKASFELLHRVDNSLSSYKVNSPIYKLNKTKKAELNPDTYEALLLSEKYYKISDGYFNIAIGSVTKDVYKFGEEEHSATLEELADTKTSFSSLAFNKTSATLGVSTKIDLGGMGKGFGVDKVVAFLKEQGVKEARVALSGDIRCLGICKIEVNDPNSTEPLVTFYTKERDMGISTSGNYNRFVKSVKNNHLINPKTKQSQQNFISITLISKLPSADLDAYATAASVMPQAMAFKFLDSLPLAYILLETNNKLVVSKNIGLFTHYTHKK